MTALLELDRVGKTYPFFALHDVQLKLDAGQILGFVGPNGAGKSTTIRIAMGLVTHDSGDVRLAARVRPGPKLEAMSDPLSEVRIDKWLWAARCFKTRPLAIAACNAGHVKLNGVSVKPAKTVRPGDNVEVRTPGGLRILEVVALAERRGPAKEAQGLYLDHSPPPPPKDMTAPLLIRERGTGRPTKRDLRLLKKMRGY